MTSVIIVHPIFDMVWPRTADRFHTQWKAQGNVEFIRLTPGDERILSEIITEPEKVRRLISLQVKITSHCLRAFHSLREAVMVTDTYYRKPLPTEQMDILLERGVQLYRQQNEGYWGQSVAEFGLALTLSALRRIPQSYHEMLTSIQPWRFKPNTEVSIHGGKGSQFADNPAFTNGTIEGKRVRIVGAGNVASRYASFVKMMGADVKAWDPYAPDPSFHRAGARRERHLSKLVKDAEIFVPMVPLTEHTKGIINKELIHMLPKGCLVVMVTRAGICDMSAIRERVLADEIFLAADVFDLEPLPLDDPLLGRENMVHTPHIAGRTTQANELWADMLLDQFLPVVGDME